MIGHAPAQDETDRVSTRATRMTPSGLKSASKRRETRGNSHKMDEWTVKTLLMTAHDEGHDEAVVRQLSDSLSVLAGGGRRELWWPRRFRETIHPKSRTSWHPLHWRHAVLYEACFLLLYRRACMELHPFIHPG